MGYSRAKPLTDPAGTGSRLFGVHAGIRELVEPPLPSLSDPKSQAEDLHAQPLDVSPINHARPL